MHDLELELGATGRRRPLFFFSSSSYHELLRAAAAGSVYVISIVGYTFASPPLSIAKRTDAEC